MQLISIRFCFFSAILLSCISCATSNPLATYVKTEKCDSTSLFLEMTKLSQRDIAQIYKGVSRINWSSQAKSFNEGSYQLLLKLDQDGNATLWSECYAKDSGFKSTVEISKLYYRGNKIIFSVSNPVYLDNNRQAVYRMIITAGSDKIVFDGIIIMVKREGKWELLEKVYNSTLH